MIKQVLNSTVISTFLVASTAFGGYMVDLTESGQGVSHNENVGLSWIVLDTNGNPTDLTLSARAIIDPSSPFDLFAFGEPGTIVFTNKGTGVQNQFGEGSKEISGGGPNQNEDIELNFNVSIFGNSLTVNFAKLELGDGLGDDDDPVVWVLYNGTEMAMFDETTWGSAYTEFDDDKGALDFAALGFTESDQIQKVIIRETKGHTLVSGAEFSTIPAPGALALLASAGLLWRRRRRNG